MKPFAAIHTMSERPACPQCRQPVMVIEIEDPSLHDSVPVEQQIACPQCGGLISSLMSVKRVLAYPAPVGDYYDEEEGQVSGKDEIPHRPIERALPGKHQRRA